MNKTTAGEKRALQTVKLFFKIKHKRLLDNMKNAIVDVVNGVPNSRFNLQVLVKQWKEQRQELNNKGILGILYFEKLTLVVTPLVNDEKKDLGQKNMAKRQYNKRERIIKKK